MTSLFKQKSDIMDTTKQMVCLQRHWNLASKVITNSTKGAATSRRLVDVFFLAMTLGIEQGGAPQCVKKLPAAGFLARG